MISNCCRFYLYLLLVLPLICCGEKNDSASLFLSGKVSGEGVSGYPDKPILVGIVKSDSVEQFNLTSLDGFVKLISVDKNDFSFQFDLSDTELSQGDKINIVAFVDVNSTGGVPTANAGDYVGFYVNEETYSAVYTLQPGLNDGFEIRLNRVISQHKTLISGNISQSTTGKMTILAYAGEITNSTFSDFNPDNIIAYAQFEKEASASSYYLEVMPYPKDLNVAYVSIIAFLDDTGSGMPAPGNVVGFHTNQIDETPELIAIDPTMDVHLTAVNIQMQFFDPDSQEYTEIRIPEPSGDMILLDGEFNLPTDFNPDEGELFVVVTRANPSSEIVDTLLSSIFYFEKMPRGENHFSLDLTRTGLKLTDEVMVMAIWDRDYHGGFPNLTQGDTVGFLQQKEQYNESIVLSQWQETMDSSQGWDFTLNRKIYTHRAALLFDINTNTAIAPQNGESLITIAVAAEGVDLLEQTIDTDYIVGMTQINIGQNGPPYLLQILPAIDERIRVEEDPFNLSDVYLLAVLDNNPANGIPDTGEYIGYYGSNVPLTNSYLPITIDIEDEIISLERKINFTGETF